MLCKKFLYYTLRRTLGIGENGCVHADGRAAGDPLPSIKIQ